MIISGGRGALPDGSITAHDPDDRSKRPLGGYDREHPSLGMQKMATPEPSLGDVMDQVSRIDALTGTGFAGDWSL
jgi:hypothetical protein